MSSLSCCVVLCLVVLVNTGVESYVVRGASRVSFLDSTDGSEGWKLVKAANFDETRVVVPTAAATTLTTDVIETRTVDPVHRQGTFNSGKNKCPVGYKWIDELNTCIENPEYDSEE